MFKNNDGTLKTSREAYKSLIGKTLALVDGTKVKIVDKLENIEEPNKPRKMYNELSKRLPRANGLRDLFEIKNINSKINENLDETIEISDLVRTKPDKEQRHSKFNIKNFDTREANIYDPDSQQAYILKLSIAELNNGEKVGYAKKTLEPNETLTKTIKKETLTSSASKNGRYSRSDVSTNRIPPTQQNVNYNTKYSIKESKNNSGSFNLTSNRIYEKNQKIKHNIYAKYGFYKYDTKFSFDHKGKEQIYSGTIVIRNDANGKNIYMILQT